MILRNNLDSSKDDLNRSKPDSKPEETADALSSKIQNMSEHPAKLNEMNHNEKRADSSGPDYSYEYIEILRAATERIVSRPRNGTHVTDLVLCDRQRVFRAIDPLPIDLKTVGFMSVGMAAHRAVEWLFLSDATRFENEKRIEFRGVSGSVDIYDKLRNIPIEFKFTIASNVMEPKPWHVQQLKWYMAILGASQGYMIYRLLLNFGTPLKAFKISMNEQEKEEQLDKLLKKANSLKKAMGARDPSLAKPVYHDPTLNWLCESCPYQGNCKRIQDAAAAA